MKKVKYIASALGAALAFGWLIWDNMRIEVKSYEVSEEKLAREFAGFKILQVSDLHNEAFGKKQKRLISKIRNEAPDIIVITGDMIDGPKMSNAFDFIREAVKIAKCYYVSGNHEAWTGLYNDKIKPLLLRYGVKVLDNGSAVIYRNGKAINLAGLADPDLDRWNKRRTASDRLMNLYSRVKPVLYGYAAKVLDGGAYVGAKKRSGVNEGKRKKYDFEPNNSVVDIADKNLSLLENENYTVLLSHRPELLNLYSDHKMDLVLTGHAHGGQIRLPVSKRGVIAVDQGLLPQYTEGIYRKGVTKMIVSRGLGNSVYFPRINNCPQLITVTLTSKQTG